MLNRASLLGVYVWRATKVLFLICYSFLFLASLGILRVLVDERLSVAAVLLVLLDSWV